MKISPKTLEYIKQELSKLLKVVDAMVARSAKNFPVLAVLSVEIQNAVNDTKNCANYSHEEACLELEQVNNVLNALKEYEEHFPHVIYIVEQFNLIVDGLRMAEETREEYELD